ncbi:MAG: hypothetical protein ACWA5P_02025 [bacterium]
MILFVKLSLIFTLFFNQNIKCEDYKKLIKSEGKEISNLNEEYLHSSWLYNIKAYKYEGDIYVISVFKRKNSVNSKEYLYCKIPSSKWNSFKNTEGSFGSEFNKKIKPYKCDCN